MPSSKNYVRDLKQEARTAKRRGDDVKNRNRKAARRKFIKLNGGCSGDVHHKDGNTNNNHPSNLACIPAKRNRSFARNKKAGKKGR